MARSKKPANARNRTSKRWDLLDETESEREWLREILANKQLGLIDSTYTARIVARSLQEGYGIASLQAANALSMGVLRNWLGRRGSVDAVLIHPQSPVESRLLLDHLDFIKQHPIGILESADTGLDEWERYATLLRASRVPHFPKVVLADELAEAYASLLTLD